VRNSQKLITWFRQQNLFTKCGQSRSLALKWTGFEIPNENIDEDDIVTDAVFFFRANEHGLYLDTMLFYPLEKGGCKNVVVNSEDIKYQIIGDKLLKWETGWVDKYPTATM
jgi:hypothetical protein